MPSIARMPSGYSTVTSRRSRTGSAASDMVQGQREAGEVVLHLEEIGLPEGLVRDGQSLDRVESDQRGVRLRGDGLRDRGVLQRLVADVAEPVGVDRVAHVLDLRRGRIFLKGAGNVDLCDVVLFREVRERLVERDEVARRRVRGEVDE